LGLTGILRQIAIQKCAQCKKEYGKHSKKGFMKCLYTANYNLYDAIIRMDQLNQTINELQKEQGKPEKITVDDKGNVKVDIVKEMLSDGGKNE